MHTKALAVAKCGQVEKRDNIHSALLSWNVPSLKMSSNSNVNCTSITTLTGWRVPIK